MVFISFPFNWWCHFLATCNFFTTISDKVCKVRKIVGKFSKDKSKVIFTFSAGHPDATYECRIDKKNFQNCKYNNITQLIILTSFWGTYSMYITCPIVWIYTSLIKNLYIYLHSRVYYFKIEYASYITYWNANLHSQNKKWQIEWTKRLLKYNSYTKIG